MYPYGLNDSVKGVGNVSKRSEGDGLIVYSLFNKHDRKFKKRTRQRQRKRINGNEVRKEAKNRLLGYKCLQSVHAIIAYLMSLPKGKTRIVVDVAQQLVSEGHIPTRIVMLVKDLMAYRQRSNVATGMNSVMKEDRERCYINVLFHNKGMNMISLDKILCSKRVMAALPKHLRGPPPIVSYTYTKN